ncbi:MAG: hypothetical protein LBJ00_14840 [Planctomycetaceae bacterium]|nr:hypothetical protein [Planctomycetaceae bacterium]
MLLYRSLSPYRLRYKVVFKFLKLNMQSQDRKAVVRGRCLLPVLISVYFISFTIYGLARGFSLT